ncbi:hypothetical protein [Gloeobacter kilaueensis]|uniref:Gasdermin bGSDM n=1 Tax=Gloeobacter kilaueensis (strain ATCC BAA-2537 / CCAP 1431/1 / ULC 316 / JS1) TaxID=1183438 RepID=U5QNR8_GLOK1|nr:hypothetical protein [Gloeobacter kilaueensis]AGY59295.1 hypothetical protein GKIL_3049 [Gloeobacter kilaueensis JS1]
MCKDGSVNFLQSVGYNVIRYPSEKFKPLQVLVRVPNRNRVIELIGPVTDLISAGPTAPEPKELDGADVSGKQSDKFELSFGLGILRDLLKTLGVGAINLSTAFSNSKEIQFVYQNVKLDSLMTTSAASYLKACKPDVSSELFDQMDEEGEAYCIIETLKSNSFSVRAFRDNGFSASIDLSVLQEALAFTPGISISGNDELVTFYKGDSNLVFGFKAIPFWVAIDSAGLPYFKIEYSSAPTSDVLEGIQTDRGNQSEQLLLDTVVLSEDLLLVKLDNGLDRPTLREMALPPASTLISSAASPFGSAESTRTSAEGVFDDLHQDPDDSEQKSTPIVGVEVEAVRPWRVAKCLEVLRGQINSKFPRRDKDSDGCIGDASHQTRNSDHNPWVVDGGIGVVTACDVTHDPAHGCNAGTIVQALWQSRDPRIKYIIWNRRIANSSPIGGVEAWTWRSYTGSNPHTEHFHLSVKSEKDRYDSTTLWSIT